MRYLLIMVLCLFPALVRAQGEIEVVGAGETGEITPDETVTGEIEITDYANISPISYVGRNGSNRIQGDYDVWRFEAERGESFIVTMTATDDTLAPTLMVINDTERIPTVTAIDANMDGDANAGVCLRELSGGQYAILAFRANNQQSGAYELTLTPEDNPDNLNGGSATTVCRVGTFAQVRGDTTVNIRSNPGTQFDVIGQMQPGTQYSYFSGALNEWLQIQFIDETGTVRNGYVLSRLVRLTGEFLGE